MAESPALRDWTQQCASPHLAPHGSDPANTETATLRAARAWFDGGDVPLAADSPVLRASRKGGALLGAGMTERALTDRVRVLGEAVGLQGLSAHDCRHFWATFWADKVDVLRLQEAGGWSSLAMPRRYVEEAQIANEGMA